MENRDLVIEKVKKTLIIAGSTFSEDKKDVYKRAIEKETNKSAKWVLETNLENALVAEKNRSPLCDDSGIPHLILDIGKNKSVSGELLDAINQGIIEGLRALPGRPMAIKGNDLQRIDQSGGLDEDPGALTHAPILFRYIDEDVIRLHILMHGGGPEIRGKTFRVFHKHKVSVLTDEIINWAVEGASMLGCTPVTIAIGIGRSHFEATSLMLQAMIEGNHNIQNELEREITDRVNKINVGPLGIGGDTTALGTFIKVGPQRASGVRIVCMRPCCGIEPRKASVELQ
jgi:fumarate hydratase subunit alpha